MDEEWHVSDSEDEENTRVNIHNNKTNSCPLNTLPSSTTGSKPSANYCIPQSFISLYERISKEGFIALHCKTSRRFSEKTEGHTKAEPEVITIVAQSNSSNNSKCNDAAGSVQQTESSNVAKNKNK